jgi:hypothetical protein
MIGIMIVTLLNNCRRLGARFTEDSPVNLVCFICSECDEFVADAWWIYGLYMCWIKVSHDKTLSEALKQSKHTGKQSTQHDDCSSLAFVN